MIAPLAVRAFYARYLIKFPFAVLLGIWSALFWSMPTVEYVVTIIEETSLVTVLRRDRAAERAALVASGTPNRSHLRSTEERHDDIKVDECLLEGVTRESGSKYDEGLLTPIKSWSIKYTMTRCRQEDWKWAVRIKSFPVNGQPVPDPESQVSFLHFYWTTAAHTTCHALGNSLVERIVSDDSLKAKLMESTWTTTWLHHGLLHGPLGPLTSTRYRDSPTGAPRPPWCLTHTAYIVVHIILMTIITPGTSSQDEGRVIPSAINFVFIFQYRPGSRCEVFAFLMVLQHVERQLAENAKVEIFHAQGCWTPEIVDPSTVSPIRD